MHKLGGFAGNILLVDLTSSAIASEPLNPELAATFIGGAGVNARLAYDLIKAQTPALSPENVIVFGAGPLVGTLMPGAGKTNFTFKSPIGKYIGTSGSGHMGAVKFAGYDHVIVTGKAESPVYLEIGDEVRIRKADHLWGKDTWESVDGVWSELGRKYSVAAIGPAGENLVTDANVVTNKYSAFGTTGLGAVMGSKNLKAIAAYGSRGIGVAEPKRFMQLVDGIRKQIMDFPFIEYFRQLGTLASLPDHIRGEPYGSIPYKNAQQVANEEILGSFLDVSQFLGPPLMECHHNISCLACPVGCKHYFRMKDGPAMPISCASAPIVNFAGICGLEGWAASFRCAELCNRLGLCYASAAGLVAMAIELFEKGIIDTKDTDGMELAWREDVVQKLLRKIAYREDLGNILADGLLKAPKHIGRGVDAYAIHYKGVGSSITDPRIRMSSYTSSLVTSTFGHVHAPKELYSQPRDLVEQSLREMGISDNDLALIINGSGGLNVGRLIRWTEDYGHVFECLGVCHFYQHLLNISCDTLAEIYSAATGISVSGETLLEGTARAFDLRKAFNIREGVSRTDDTVPKRFLTESIEVRGEIRPPYDRDELEKMITGYYEARGWHPQEGTMSAHRLAELTGQPTGLTTQSPRHP